MRCPECGEEVYGQFTHHVWSGMEWIWKCKKTEPSLAELLDLIQKIIGGENMMNFEDYETCLDIVAYLKGDPEPLEKLAKAGEE
jgi:hypothetical protein